jgi:hypothetical protein
MPSSATPASPTTCGPTGTITTACVDSAAGPGLLIAEFGTDFSKKTTDYTVDEKKLEQHKALQ